MKLVFLTSLHPKKLNSKYWAIREIEYLNTIKYYRYSNYQCYLIDNSIDNLSEILNTEVQELISEKDFPVISHKNIFSKKLYNDDNFKGFLGLIDLMKVKFKNDSNYPLVSINGRILNYETIINLIESRLKKKEFVEDNLPIIFQSKIGTKSINLSESIILFPSKESLSSFNSNIKMIPNLYDKNENILLEELYNSDKIKIVNHEKIILKFDHDDEDNYLSTKITCL